MSNLHPIFDNILSVWKPSANTKPGHRYTMGKQPCANLRRGAADIAALGIGNGMNVHQCPICWGNRTWCENCHTDHHDGGWETCKPEAYRCDDE